VVSSLRRLLSLVLVASFTTLNVGVAEFHVHADSGAASKAHRHGPASHHHDTVHHEPSDAAQVSALDEDDTVISVPLVVAAPRLVKPMTAITVEPILVAPDESAIVDNSRIVARAHGPPSTVQHSLRAPPAPSFL
jgi:hypothetical protein